MPSSGVCVLMNRRWVCDASNSNTLSTFSVWMSTQGDNRVSGAGSSGVWKTSSAHCICIHVVPHFDGVEMTMSSSRNSKPSHRRLSMITFRYRRRVSSMSHPFSSAPQLATSDAKPGPR